MTMSSWVRGFVAVLALSASPLILAGDKEKEKQEYKMTLVSFKGPMQANSQTNTVSFWRNVQVLSLPWPRHDEPLELEKVLLQNPLPEGALYLRCERVKVLDTPADPKTKRPPELEDLIRKCKGAGLDGLDLDGKFPIDSAFVGKVHAAGLKLYTWTVNDAEAAKRQAAAGVDGITTDRPLKLREALGR